MPIAASDIKFRLSINTGPGDSTAQGNPNDSIGGFVSTTEITDATLHNLFDVITGDENAASTVDYRVFFIANKHATLTWQGVKVWLQSETAGGANAAIALDGLGVKAINSASAQAERIANETTAPSGETFSAPTSKAAGLSVGNLAPNEVIAVWVRRTATNSAALNLDGVVIRAEGDTAA
jgi:hypothetical protein